MPKKTPRLRREDWLDHGLRVLAKSGPDQLKANPLAKSLGVSRGSFYWHFEDLAAFHEALLHRWREETLTKVIESAPQGDARTSLLALLREASEADDDLERAMRSWAVLSPKVAAAVARMDGERSAYIAQLLGGCGIGEAEAEMRGAFLYWAKIGRIMVGAPASKHQEETAETLTLLLAGDAANRTKA